MATATTTFSQLSPNLKAVHTGINVAGGHLSASATLSPSGVLNMVKVPNGATIVDFWLKVVSGGVDNNIQIGTSQTPSGIMSITTLTATFTATHANYISTTIRAPGGTGSQSGLSANTDDFLPIRISLSDDAQPSSVWVQARIGADVSASAFFTFMLFYTMDGLAGRTTIR